MPTAQISHSTTNKTLLVAADPAGRRIRVQALVLTCSADQSALFTSEGTGSTTVCPALLAEADAGALVLPHAPRSEGVTMGWFDSLPGEALHITLSSATATTGLLVWSYVIQ